MSASNNTNASRLPIGKLIQQHRRSLELTQEALARAAGVPYNSLIKIESGAIKNPSSGIVSKLARALNLSIDSILAPRTFQGQQAIEEIWSDALTVMTTPGDFMCISGVEERTFLKVTKHKVVSFVNAIKARGCTQRILCSERDRVFLEGEHIEYRSIPSKNFNPTPMYVYADRVAVLIWGPPQQAIIIENAALADAYRKQFLFIWEHAKPVRRKVSTRA